MTRNDMVPEDTRDIVIRRYHDLLGRGSVSDPRQKARMFRLYGRAFDALLPADRNARIMDAGCGEGSLLLYLQERGYSDLAGFDLSEQNVELCHGLGFEQVTQGSLLLSDSAVPLGDGRNYDVIFLLDVIEHLPKSRAIGVVRRLRESLRPRGLLVVQTPNGGSIFGLHQSFGDLTHEFLVNEDSAKTLFLGAGFALADIDIRAEWGAERAPGYLREAYLWLVHQLVFAAMGRARPRIPTPNLLILARRHE